jgi:hypothetical protein
MEDEWSTKLGRAQAREICMGLIGSSLLYNGVNQGDTGLAPAASRS